MTVPWEWKRQINLVTTRVEFRALFRREGTRTGAETALGADERYLHSILRMQPIFSLCLLVL